MKYLVTKSGFFLHEIKKDKKRRSQEKGGWAKTSNDRFGISFKSRKSLPEPEGNQAWKRLIKGGPHSTKDSILASHPVAPGLILGISVSKKSTILNYLNDLSTGRTAVSPITTFSLQCKIIKLKLKHFEFSLFAKLYLQSLTTILTSNMKS